MIKTTMDFSEKTVRALSWKEPYGSLMLHGKIETRTWNTNYRGLVLMCASKKGYDFKTVLNISGYDNFYRMKGHNNFESNNFTNFIGHAFAIGRLVNCRPMKEDDEIKTFVRYYPDLYCHIYEDVKAIEPFPWKGKQGWKTLSVEEKRLLKILR